MLVLLTNLTLFFLFRLALRVRAGPFQQAGRTTFQGSPDRALRRDVQISVGCVCSRRNTMRPVCLLKMSTLSQVASQTKYLDATRITSISQPVPEGMPSHSMDDTCCVKGVNVLTSLGTGDLDVLLAVLVRAVSADDVGAVKGEGKTVYATGYFGQCVLADPVVGIPEGDDGVAAACRDECAVGRVLDRVCCTCVCRQGME